MVELCTESVNRSGSSRWSDFQPCGRITVEDGLCSLHLKVRARREAKSRAWGEREKKNDHACEVAHELSKLLSCEVRPHYIDFQTGYSQNIVEIRIEDLARVTASFMEAHGG